MNEIRKSLGGYSPIMPLYATIFWLAWITVAFSGDMIVLPYVSPYATTSVTLISVLAATSITLILSGFFPRQAQTLVQNAKILYAVAVVWSLSTVAISSVGSICLWLLIIASGITGFCIGVFTLKTAMLYCEAELKKALFATCVSIIIGVLIYCTFSMARIYFSATVIMIATALFPLMAMFILLLPTNLDTPLEDAASIKLSKAFWRSVAFASVIALCVMSVRGAYPNALNATAFTYTRGITSLSLIVVAIILLLAIASVPRNSSFGGFLYWIFLLSILVIVLVIFLQYDFTIASVVSEVANGLLLFATWNFFTSVSHHSGMSSTRVFGFGLGIVAACMAAGFVLGDAFSSFFLDQSTRILTIGLLTIGLVAAIAFLRYKDIESCMAPTEAMIESVGDTVIAGDSEPDSSLPSKSAFDDAHKPGKFKLKCQKLSEDCGLSPREQEVFFLLAKGKEAQAIADELFISFNTARTHIRKIYTKLNVHSRRELSELIDGVVL